MMSPTFDRDGYPTDEILNAIEHAARPAEALDMARAAWHWPEFAHETLRAAEYALVSVGESEPHRYARFATGGWSGNESIIGALNRNVMVRALCWRVSARGGLHIYEYPIHEAEPMPGIIAAPER